MVTNIQLLKYIWAFILLHLYTVSNTKFHNRFVFRNIKYWTISKILSMAHSIEICNKAIVQDLTLNASRHYTLWTINVRKLVWPVQWSTVSELACDLTYNRLQKQLASHDNKFDWFWLWDRLMSNQCSPVLTPRQRPTQYRSCAKKAFCSVIYYVNFYRASAYLAMKSPVLATVGMSSCPSVRPAVSLSVTRWHWVKTTPARIPQDVRIFAISHEKRNFHRRIAQEL